MIINLFTDLLF